MRGSYFLIIGTLVLIPLASAGWFDWIFPDLAPSDTTDVTVQVGNTPPTISAVQALPVINLLAGTTVNVAVNFTASDANGAADLNDASALATLTQVGEPARSGGCIVEASTSAEKTYICTVTLQYYDASGVWTLNVSVADSASQNASDDSQTATVALLRDITITPANINFPTVAPGLTDILASVNTTVTNNGNFVVPSNGDLTITAFNLTGQVTPTENIPATSFTSVGSVDAATVCSTGTPLVENVATTIGSITLNRGATGNTEDIAHCLTLVPAGLSSQAYVAQGGQAWVISI